MILRKRNLQFFLYRRLARWITCEFGLSSNVKITLPDKYEVASFKDVFCHPFYWQIFHYVAQSPKLVLDCGAHCGHFTVLADICFQSKFGISATEYILVEPNPYLIPVIFKNLENASLLDRTQVKQGLLGCISNQDKLWIPRKNYLAASLHPVHGAKSYQVQPLDLIDVIGDQVVDLMKIDIEGGEFNLVHSNLAILSKVNLLFMELHDAPDDKHKQLFRELASVGLYTTDKPIEAHGQQLVIFQR